MIAGWQGVHLKRALDSFYAERKVIIFIVAVFMLRLNVVINFSAMVLTCFRDVSMMIPRCCRDFSTISLRFFHDFSIIAVIGFHVNAPIE